MLCRQLMKKYVVPNMFIRKFAAADNLVRVEEKHGVRRIVMVDVGTRNALSIPMTESILCALTENIESPAVRCVIISHEGNIFSAGHNLKHLIDDKSAVNVFEKFVQLMDAIINCPVPVITAVDGLAAAAGCQLVAQSDISVCTQRSTFSTPGANFGIFCSTPGIPLSRSVPRKLSSYMLFTGLHITAEEAVLHGLVSRVSGDRSDLEIELEKITDAIKIKSRSILELGKKFYYDQMNLPLKTAYLQGSNIMKANVLMPDGQEGLKSFKEKRKPIWKHN